MYRIALSILFLASSAFARNHIDVVYPEEDQQIAAVDSTFIFGNTNPKAKLTINGIEVDVYKDGGFLAFLPIERGEFEFELISEYKDSTVISRRRIYVGRMMPLDTIGFIDSSSLMPRGRTILTGDKMFEFSLSARSGGRVYCSFAGDSTWTSMYDGSIGQGSGSVFGDVALPVAAEDFSKYTGYLSIAALKDSSRVYYLYEKDLVDSSGEHKYTEFELDSTEYYIIKMPELPPRVVTLTGRPHIIRVGPAEGYKLVNQPDGIRFLYGGETPDYYCLNLAPGATGYVRKIDARMEPEGTMPPSGEVSFVRIDNHAEYIQMSLDVGDNLPFEIHEDGDLMTVDLLCVNSDTDWIRFNNEAQKYIKSIWWNQPQDGVYRLSIRWHESHFWGYDSYYDADTFILKLNKNPKKNGFLRSPVKDLRIVIDPGHSHDTGAMGPTGLTEKNANLWIAHELRKILLKKGAEVLMTRMGHENVGLYDRVDIADKWDADLLISIHNNALPDGINPFTHNGTSVYYYFNQARPLAEAIHKQLVKATGLTDHGLYHGNLALTRFAECPSVLVECAFMMIPEQEAMLKTDKFQRKCAKAIYKGICDYLQGE